MAEANVQFEVKMMEVEADGSTCGVCGDMIFLKAYRMDLHSPNNSKYVGNVDQLFCQACAETIKDGYYDGEQDQFAEMEA